jgi:hypothetical protein
LYFYENRKMKLVEIVLRRGQKDEGEWWWRGVYLIKIYCKHVWKCNNLSPLCNDNMWIKK